MTLGSIGGRYWRGVPFRGGRRPTGYGVQPHGKRVWLDAYIAGKLLCLSSGQGSGWVCVRVCCCGLPAVPASVARGGGGAAAKFIQ